MQPGFESNSLRWWTQQVGQISTGDSGSVFTRRRQHSAVFFGTRPSHRPTIEPLVLSYAIPPRARDLRWTRSMHGGKDHTEGLVYLAVGKSSDGNDGVRRGDCSGDVILPAVHGSRVSRMASTARVVCQCRPATPTRIDRMTESPARIAPGRELSTSPMASLAGPDHLGFRPVDQHWQDQLTP
jgi:hypothetical protein